MNEKFEAEIISIFKECLRTPISVRAEEIGFPKASLENALIAVVERWRDIDAVMRKMELLVKSMDMPHLTEEYKKQVANTFVDLKSDLIYACCRRKCDLPTDETPMK